MATYVPVFQTQYVAEGLLLEEKVAALIASGVMDVATLTKDVGGASRLYGDFVNIPQFIRMPTPTRVDITSTATAASVATAVDANNQKFPVLRDQSTASFANFDNIRTGEDFGSSLERSLGVGLAERLLTVLGLTLSGAVGAVAAHVSTDTGNTMTVDKVAAAQGKLGDHGGQLNTLVVHSHVWNDIKQNIRANFKYTAMTAASIVTGEVPQLLGLDFIIVSDSMPVTTGITAVDIYESFLLGPNSLYYGHQEDPNIEVEKDVALEVPKWYVRGNMSYVLGPRGVTFGGAANPSDAVLTNTNNWTASYNDARSSLSVKILSAGGNGTGTAINT